MKKQLSKNELPKKIQRWSDDKVREMQKNHPSQIARAAKFFKKHGFKRDWQAEQEDFIKMNS